MPARRQHRRLATKRTTRAQRVAAETRRVAAAHASFTRNPTNIFHDDLWVVAACGARHHGRCCTEPTCCIGDSI